MSKIQRHNNQAGVTHVADLLPTDRALAPREPVRCDLLPVAQNPVDAAKLAFDRKMADALRHDSDSESGHAD